MGSGTIFVASLLGSGLLFSLHILTSSFPVMDTQLLPETTERRRGRGMFDKMYGSDQKKHNNKGLGGCPNLPAYCSRLALGINEDKATKLAEKRMKLCKYNDAKSCETNSKCVEVRIRDNSVEGPKYQQLKACNENSKTCTCLTQSRYNECHYGIQSVLNWELTSSDPDEPLTNPQHLSTEPKNKGSDVSLSEEKLTKNGCIAWKHLLKMDSSEMIFKSNRFAKVLCDHRGSCATAGHMVTWHRVPMMMKTYCEQIRGGCVEHTMEINSPRWRLRRLIPSHTQHLMFTPLAARYSTKMEENILRAAIRSGL